MKKVDKEALIRILQTLKKQVDELKYQVERIIEAVQNLPEDKITHQ